MNLKFKVISKDESASLAKWLSSDTWPFFIGHSPTMDDVIQRINEGAFFSEGELNFWILNSVDERIGLVELYQLNDLAPMFSVRFRKDARGKGYGKTTIEWLTKYIFENYPDKKRIEAQTREDNVAMRKLFNRTGYIKEAYFRKASPTETGGRVASVAYGILKEDWLSGRTTPVQWERDSFFSEDLIGL